MRRTELYLLPALKDIFNQKIDEAIARIPPHHRDAAIQNRQYYFEYLVKHYYDTNKIIDIDITYKGNVL